MKKFFLSLLALCAFTASAQNEIVVGDMNDDGVLSIEDVTLLTSTLLGEREIITHKISSKESPTYSEDANGHRYVDLGLPPGTF